MKFQSRLRNCLNNIGKQSTRTKYAKRIFSPSHSISLPSCIRLSFLLIIDKLGIFELNLFRVCARKNQKSPNRILSSVFFAFFVASLMRSIFLLFAVVCMNSVCIALFTWLRFFSLFLTLSFSSLQLLHEVNAVIVNLCEVK